MCRIYFQISNLWKENADIDSFFFAILRKLKKYSSEKRPTTPFLCLASRRRYGRAMGIRTDTRLSVYTSVWWARQGYLFLASKHFKLSLSWDILFLATKHFKLSSSWDILFLATKHLNCLCHGIFYFLLPNTLNCLRHGIFYFLLPNTLIVFVMGYFISCYQTL